MWLVDRLSHIGTADCGQTTTQKDCGRIIMYESQIAITHNDCGLWTDLYMQLLRPAEGLSHIGTVDS